MVQSVTTILDNMNQMKERLIKTSNIANDVANYLKKQKQISFRHFWGFFRWCSHTTRNSL